MLALHGRTYEQGFMGEANWEPIYRVKQKINIPVFGNGDIRSGADAVRLVKDLDGVLIGRATVGNPWIFAEVQEALNPGLIQGIESGEVTWDKKFEMLRQHARTKFAQKGQRGLVEMRKFIPAYIKGLPGASELRASTNTISSLEDIEYVIEQIQAIVDAQPDLELATA